LSDALSVLASESTYDIRKHSRYDGPNFQFFFEPSTAVRLKHRLGFYNALVFDISCACAGMFAAIHVIDAMIRAGLVKRGMVVSGEYITPLTETAQKEIETPSTNAWLALHWAMLVLPSYSKPLNRTT
jgi:3-oxoacyl-[acyl-carrier-protein] synthase III